MYYETLTDLLNNDPAAYEYFYGLPPEMQTALQQQGGIRSLSQLRQAAAGQQLQHARALPAKPASVVIHPRLPLLHGRHDTARGPRMQAGRAHVIGRRPGKFDAGPGGR